MGFAVVSTAVLFLFGCQTLVPITYTQPARLNMSGISRVAIDSDNGEVASYVSRQLTATGKYAIASDAELQEWNAWLAEHRALLKLLDYQQKATEISPADLVKAYTDNAARADLSYDRKALKLSGTVAEIQQASKGSYFVRLDVGKNSVDVFFFSHAQIQMVALLNKGQEVTVFGDCNGFKKPDTDDTGEILRILGAGQHVNILNATFPVILKDYPGKVDAVLTLNTTSSVKDSSYFVKRSYTDKQGKIVSNNVRFYDCIVTVAIDYNLLRTKDISIVGQGTKSASSPKRSGEDRDKLVSDLFSQASSVPLKQIANEMVPMQQSLTVTLAKSDNKASKKAMKAALKLVKAKDYSGAAQAYGKVYAQYADFAAGYNQAVLTEAVEGTEKAIGLMESLAKRSGNPTAQDMLSAMKQRIAANQQSAQQLAK
jgi:hypothetical protein